MEAFRPCGTLSHNSFAFLSLAINYHFFSKDGNLKSFHSRIVRKEDTIPISTLAFRPNKWGQDLKQNTDCRIMAVRISTKPNLCDDEDEKPLVFKRSNAKSKQNQLDGQLKQLPVQNKSTTIKEESNSIEHPAEENSDSEDAKPIKARLGKPCEDSDDDKPLSSRITPKKVGTSGSQPYNSKERKPVASKVQKNSSSTTDKGKTSYVISTKRPLDKANISEKSSAKRPKVSAKKEPKGEDDDDFIPISQRIKKATSDNKSAVTKQKLTKVGPSSIKKKIKKGQKASQFSKYSKSTTVPPSSNDGQKKWTSLVHNGVIFPPPYKPHGVKMLYSGKPVTLSPEQEEVATMYAVMKDTDYVQKQTFRNNFWNDWHQLLGKNHIIQKLDACDFAPIYDWYQNEKEKKKQMSTEEKKALKEDKLKEEEKYMWAVVDGVKEKVGNFRVEPPGLFRGRGEHPKSGKLKRRIRPSDVTINIGKDAPIPECPIPGESWKEVRHDNTVTWLAFWNDPINQREFKYVFLAPSSSLKGQSDKEKYEKARMLKDYIGNIRAAYTRDFTSKDGTKRQIAVATYLIDKLALRAGNEKDDDEADTFGSSISTYGQNGGATKHKQKMKMRSDRSANISRAGHGLWSELGR
ncbi:hypothetical protein Prudu_020954 [Prunus dulcis]|uniref:DNA topoisomerase n=1 Tax=Prunus dulcis TaxID=3755 RepID=A0A4Y1RWH1_PRUDU|nr:hypothetical protein Prudu_020954 [Prunus dulcis]